jgi:RNA polymerase sigma-70 factor (ECF subfamily)
VTVDQASAGDFERVVLPFMNDAYTLARYLMRDEHDAQDIVQESFLRALRYYNRHPVGNPRAWLLTIVRHTCYSWKTGQRASIETEAFDETVHHAPDARPDPAAQLIAASTRDRILATLDSLPAEFREVLILREIQELSYRDISQVIDAPIGTVMSRLSRARLRMQAALGGRDEAMR